MNLYTFTQAAQELGVSRQTVYTRVNRQPGVYTLTQDGKRLITLHGLGMLREEIVKKTSKIDAERPEVDTPAPDILTQQREMIDTLQTRIKDLEEQLAEARRLQAEAEGYARGIKEANETLTLSLVQPRRTGWFSWFTRKPKEETPSK